MLEEAVPEWLVGTDWGRRMVGGLEWNPTPDPDHLTWKHDSMTT